MLKENVDKFKLKTFISFDYDHDHDIKECLVGQAKNPDSSFEITDMPIKETINDWKENARRRIKSCDVVVVFCGEHTYIVDFVRLSSE